MKCEVNGIWSWGDEDDACYVNLSHMPTGVGAGLVTASVGADCAGPQIWALSWALRRQLWRDLLGTGDVEVTIRHDNVDGCGAGSVRFTVDSSRDVTFNAPDFYKSDAFYMNFAPEVGIFSLLTAQSRSGWSEFALENLMYEEFDDSDLYEYSFRSVDRLVVNTDIAASMESWSGVPEDLQVAAVAALLADRRAQMAEFEEIILGHEDVLAAVAAHPETSVLAWQEMAAECEACCREVLLGNPVVPDEVRVIARSSGG